MYRKVPYSNPLWVWINRFILGGFGRGLGLDKCIYIYISILVLRTYWYYEIGTTYVLDCTYCTYQVLYVLYVLYALATGTTYQYCTTGTVTVQYHTIVVPAVWVGIDKCISVGGFGMGLGQDK